MNHLGLKHLDELMPDFREGVDLLLAQLTNLELFVAITAGRRTIAEQNALYAQGRTAKGNIVTNAKGGQSAHNFGCAVDLCPLAKNGDLNWGDQHGFNIIGQVAESLGMNWGGHFHSILDLPHVESATWRDIQVAWKAGKVAIA